MKKSNIQTDQTAFFIGGWYRWKDAAIVTTRIDFGAFNIGFSYDINLSKLTAATRGNGGPEVSFIYTGCFAKGKSVTLCPVM